ncbi:hypothetical protein O9K51_09331 [Purpureocillium lavendulum]|uniref:Uncharacterized protein n=1 Tax=Purpureocillium lavendulum TaxID=1247861 RepID=A0AB34FFV3_9HYPO|nr:hypothetical protein O9K51_09331 [Purpureocillium lavendulum]
MIGQQNAIDRLFEQQAARQEGHDIEQEHHLLAAVDDELYNQALVNLLTAHSLPHSLVEWPEWYAMLHTVNYMAPGVVTQSRGQVPKLLEASFITHREKLRSKLKSSLTQVHFSIDIWSSPNHHSLLGIVAHFIDRECRQLRKALLALRELEGAHSGEAIAETFLTVIDSYGLHGQVGYFTLDNAYNNDTMLQAIAKACDFDTAHRRLRCNGHIINLAVQAFLFGRNKDASDEALRQVSQLSKDEQEGVADRRDTATAWRRHGALGMLHNLVVWVRSSGQRYQAFSKAAGRMIPQDNSTRWNSWYLMIHVAIKARKEVNSFIDDHYTEGDISLDYLHPEHWQELQEIHDFLQPFHEITKDTQWDNSSLDEVICSMDFLITHYKASTEKFRHSLTMTDRIMTSWYKFDDYYRRTDDSPVYAAAILLHPSLRRAHLHEAWKDQSQYIGPAVEAVRKLWEDYKPRQVPTINEDLSAYEAYKQRIYQPPSSHDEFNRFIDGPTLPIGSSSALSWWLEPTQATSFPNLYRLAVNIFSIPAMSAEAERVFSGARRTITWDRSRLSVKTIEQTECLKHWMKSGLLDRAFMSPDTTEVQRLAIRLEARLDGIQGGLDALLQGQVPITFTGYFGAGSAAALAPTPALSTAPTLNLHTAPAPAPAPTQEPLVPGMPIVTALARVFTVRDVWKEWEEGFAGQKAVRELEETWGSRWRPGNGVRVQFCRRKVIWDELLGRMASGKCKEEAVAELEHLRAGRSLNRLVDELKQRRRWGQDRGQGQGQIRVQVGTPVPDDPGPGPGPGPTLGQGRRGGEPGGGSGPPVVDRKPAV